MRALALLLLALAACSAERTAGPDQLNDGGASDLGAGFDLAQCVQVLVSPPGGTAPIQLVAQAQVVTASAPTWSVLGPIGLLSATPLDQSGLRVGLLATEPGTYLFRVEFAGGKPCPGQASAIVSAPQAIAVAYRLRLTPPASSELAPQDLIVPIYGKTPQTAHDLVLVAATWISGILRGPGGSGVPGQVLLVPDQGPEFRTRTGDTGSFALPMSPGLMHRVVLIPDDLALAPRLLGPLLGADLLGLSFAVRSGVGVSGLLRDLALAPIAGAAVSLRQGALPSGLGRSLADGSYALRAEPGLYSLAASAPGWPDLSLDGLDLPIGGQVLGIDHLLARLPVSLRLVLADGTSPAAGVKISLRSTVLGGAGRVTSSSGARLASGVRSAQGITGSDGVLAGLLLPAGTYDLLAEPPSLATGEARTGLRVVVSGPGELLVQLVRPARLSGRVHDQFGAPVQGARVRARSQGGHLVESTTDVTGAYALDVDAGLPQEVFVTPPNGAYAAAQAYIGTPSTGLGSPLGIALPPALDLVLPPGVQLSGRVTGPSGNGLGGVAIDVLCLSCAEARPLAHAESVAGGGYILYVPDPGTLSLDAGTD